MLVLYKNRGLLCISDLNRYVFDETKWLMVVVFADDKAISSPRITLELGMHMAGFL